MPRARTTIGRLMIAVGVFGGLLGCLRGPAAVASTACLVLALGPVGVATLAPVIYARPRRRTLAASWVFAAWPLAFPWSVHVQWLCAYAGLGTPPDCPPATEMLFPSSMMILLAAILSTPACLFFLYVFMGEPQPKEIYLPLRFGPIFAATAAWVLTIAIIRSDPVGAFNCLAD